MKKIVKRAITLAVMATVVVSTAVCSGQKESGVETLIVAGRGGTHIDAMNAVKGRFEEAHNVKIEVLALESGDLKQKVSLDAGNKEGSYDLIMADDPWMPEFCDAGLYANLEELGVEGDSDFIEANLNLGRYPYKTGALYALPLVGNVQLFFYNKALYDAQGLTPPTSWEEVLESASKIKAATGKPGYLIRGQQGNSIVSDYLPLYWAKGGSVFTDDWRASINNDKAKEALKLYIALLEQGNNLNKNEIVAAVSNGDAGMSLGWPSWYISGKEAAAAFAPIPSKFMNSDKEYTTGMIGNWMIGVAANSTKKQLAADFLSFLCSAEVQKEMAVNGGVPTRRSVYQDAELSAMFPHYSTQMAALENSVARPRTPLWSEVESVLGAELSAAVTGTKSIDEALADAEEDINKVMSK